MKPLPPPLPVEGAEKAPTGPVIPPELAPAITFVQAYAKTHEYFISEEVCDAFKKAGGQPPPGAKGWRDKWAGVMTRSAALGYIKKGGKAAPTSGSTHMSSVALWQSRLFTGERTLKQPSHDYIEQMRMKWITKEITDLRQLLWAVHDHAFDAGLTAKPKKPNAGKLQLTAQKK